MSLWTFRRCSPFLNIVFSIACFQFFVCGPPSFLFFSLFFRVLKIAASPFLLRSSELFLSMSLNARVSGVFLPRFEIPRPCFLKSVPGWQSFFLSEQEQFFSVFACFKDFCCLFVPFGPSVVTDLSAGLFRTSVPPLCRASGTPCPSPSALEWGWWIFLDGQITISFCRVRHSFIDTDPNRMNQDRSGAALPIPTIFAWCPICFGLSSSLIFLKRFQLAPGGFFSQASRPSLFLFCSRGPSESRLSLSFPFFKDLRRASLFLSPPCGRS